MARTSYCKFVAIRCYTATMDREIIALFANSELRLTRPRQVIFDVMHQANAPLTITTIAQLCPSIERTSVYRTLGLFVQLGIAEIVPLGWKQQYELTSPFRVHHHHLSCTKCGNVIDIHSKKFELLIASIAKQNNFTAQDHTLEVRGLCVNCR